MKIGFFLWMCYRGTTKATLDYARGCKHYGIDVIIFYGMSNIFVKEIFEIANREFNCVRIESDKQIKENIKLHGVDMFYTLMHGQGEYVDYGVPTLFHSVFVPYVYPNSATIFRYPGRKLIPHIINKPEIIQNNDFRKMYNIPEKAIVVGRIGGELTFSIHYVKQVIAGIINKLPNLYFVFVCTEQFYEHPRLKFIPHIYEETEKQKFIQSCDYMIHARASGETFGIACAEFAINNKPVITTRTTFDGFANINNEHIINLGSMGIVFDTPDQLIEILYKISMTDTKEMLKKCVEGECFYKMCTEDYVMNLFFESFGYKREFENITTKFLTTLYKDRKSILTYKALPKVDFKNCYYSPSISFADKLTTIINNKDAKKHTNEEISLIYTNTLDIDFTNSDIYAELEKEGDIERFKSVGYNVYPIKSQVESKIAISYFATKKNLSEVLQYSV